MVHPNQGELISCDQAGRIKQWDLSENICTHELVRLYLAAVRIRVTQSALTVPMSRRQAGIRPCDPSALRTMVLASSRVASRLGVFSIYMIAY